MQDQNSNTITFKEKLENTELFNKIVLESSPDCLKLLDVNGRIQFMNFNGLCQMEIDDFTLFKGQLWWDLWGKENEELVKQAVQVALKGEATEFSAFCATTKGTPKWWHVTITPVGSATQGIYQLISVSRDITAQKNAENELKALNNLLEQKVRIRTEELLEKNIQLEKKVQELALFNYIASHDLQEPLRKIQMFSKLILESDNEISETNHNFKRIISATERMRNLIEALSKFTVSKNLAIIFEACDLNEILVNVIDQNQTIIDKKEAIIKVNKLPIVRGSNVLLFQLFNNLLTNSLKYSKTEVRSSIEFNCEEISANLIADIPIQSKSNTFYAIKITDNGIGFQNEYKHIIFEAFKRLHNKDEFSGVGIGLAICKIIVEKHNGWIVAQSTVNIGSSFTIYFPKD